MSKCAKESILYTFSIQSLKRITIRKRIIDQKSFLEHCLSEINQSTKTAAYAPGALQISHLIYLRLRTEFISFCTKKLAIACQFSYLRLYPLGSHPIQLINRTATILSEWLEKMKFCKNKNSIRGFRVDV